MNDGSSCPPVRVATCSLAQHALDFEGNKIRIAKSIERAKARGARYRLGPELEIPGYGCQDHFLENDTFRHSWQVLADLLVDEKLTYGIVCDIGIPAIHRGVRYNCRVFVLDGKILLVRPKLYMANDGNYREHRYFTPWHFERKNEMYVLPDVVRRVTGQKTCPFGFFVLDFKDTCLAAETCEELFTPQSPHILLGLNGVDIISNGSGSHHQLRKLNTRVNLMKNATSKGGGAYLYANQQGFDGGRLYFDGCAMIVVNGSIRAQGTQFSVCDIDVVIANIDVDAIRSYRASISSRSDQASEASAIERIAVDFALGRDSYMATPIIQLRTHKPEEEIGLGPACWLWDYLRRSGAGGYFLPLSGGADSASTCAIVGIMCHLVVEAVQNGDVNVLEDVRRITRQTKSHLETLKRREDKARCDLKNARTETEKQYATERVSKAQALMKALNLEYKPSDPRELCGRIMHTAYMGTENSGNVTRTRAIRIANQIGTFHMDCKVDDIIRGVDSTYRKTAEIIERLDVVGGMPKDKSPGFKNEKRMCWMEDLAKQNIQARSRMVYSYKLAQMLATPAVRDKGFLLVLGSANVDEAIYGYYTKYDCSAADLNPIGGVCKTDLKLFLKWAGRTYKWPSLLETERAPPSAELRPGEENQTDEDDMKLTYAELSVLGKLRKIDRLGIFSLTRRLIDVWGHQERVSTFSVATDGSDMSVHAPSTIRRVLSNMFGGNCFGPDAFCNLEVDFVSGQSRVQAKLYPDRHNQKIDLHDTAFKFLEKAKKEKLAFKIDNVEYKICGGAVKSVQYPMQPKEVFKKVERFFTMHMRNRHKMTTLTPSYHAENYSPDDNRFDLRPFCYKLPLSYQWRDTKAMVDRAQADYVRRQQGGSV